MRWRVNNQRKTCVLFGAYCLVLLWIVLFKMAFSMEDIRALQAARSVNWIPFFYEADIGRFHRKETFLNVLIFIPLGLYFGIFGLKPGKAVALGLGISLGLEISQFLLAIGASDVTDLLTNMFGTALGLCLYALLRKLYRDKQKADRFLNTLATAALILFAAMTTLLLLSNS
jgi:glycopeptide antibiotics resistance protein